MGQAWAPVTPLQARSVRFENDPRMLHRAASEVAVVLRRPRSPAASTAGSSSCPYAAIDRVRARLISPPRSAAPLTPILQ